MDFINSFLTNYMCAFLHGVIHLLIILPFSKEKWRFAIVVVATGCATLLEFWLLSDIVRLDFLYTKTILTLTAAIIGFGCILEFSFPVIIIASITALILNGFSYLMLTGLNAIVGSKLFWVSPARNSCR